MTGSKPTVESLGIDVATAHWLRSGRGDRADGRVLVYDRFEWECFLDGVRAGEFDAAAC
jgi:hypothetical protein